MPESIDALLSTPEKFVGRNCKIAKVLNSNGEKSQEITLWAIVTGLQFASDQITVFLSVPEYMVTKEDSDQPWRLSRKSALSPMRGTITEFLVY